jgi:hypothetical protein
MLKYSITVGTTRITTSARSAITIPETRSPIRVNPPWRRFSEPGLVACPSVDGKASTGR